MSRKRNEAEVFLEKPAPVFETNYKCCSQCERRIHKVLFLGEDGIVCKGCRCPAPVGSTEVYGEEVH